MKEKLSRFALSLMLALALYAAFLPTASADDLTESLHVAVDGTGAYLFFHQRGNQRRRRIYQCRQHSLPHCNGAERQRYRRKNR
ncbi:MAG: hypothetical protein ACLR4A_05150 [Christensenellales bacterium]